MKLKEIALVEKLMADPQFVKGVKKTLELLPKAIGRKFTVQQTKEVERGKNQPQRTVSFELDLKFPSAGKKGSPFEKAKHLSDKGHDEIVDIVKKELSRVGIQAKSLDDVGRGARKGETIFAIDELGKGWISIFIQHGAGE